jgi:uncharacterized protein (DUF433 family)
MVDWSNCPDVESIPGRCSGAWVAKGSRIPADFIIDQAEDGFSAEEIAAEIYEGLSVDAVRRIIAYYRRPGMSAAS